MSNRYFYHSFPRQSSRRPPVDGLKVLKSFCDLGFLLTPESMPFDIGRDEPLRTLQRRMCLTELDQSELQAHAKDFGEFALEFTIDSVRALGAIPAFYLPSKSKTNSDLGLAGSKLALYLAQTHEFLSRIHELRISGKDDHFAAVVEWLRLKHPDGSIAEISQFAFALEALMNLAIPTENLTYVGELGYYRQREWRIIYAFLENEVCPAQFLSEEGKTALVEINGWFNEVPSGGNKPRVDMCLHIPKLGGKPALEHVRRILVPDDLVDDADAIVRSAGFSVDVEGSSQAVQSE